MSALDYQVLFFPLDDINCPSSIVAFDPFTRVTASGSSVLDASRKWLTKARKLHSRYSFALPKYLLKYTKVYYGTSCLGLNVFIMVIDENKSVAFCPKTEQVAVIRGFNGTNSVICDCTIEPVGGETSVEWVPSTCMDWKIVSSPLFTSEPPSPVVEYLQETSLTPNYIN